MFSFIRDKIVGAAVSKSPVHKKALEAGRKTLAKCTVIKTLIKLGRDKGVQANITEWFEKINSVIKNKNPILLREPFVTIASQLADFMVLEDPKKLILYPKIMKQDCISGKLRKHIVEIGKKDSQMKKDIYGTRNSPDILDKEYMSGFIRSKIELLSIAYSIFNAARIELKDCNPNEKRDWHLPLLHSLCVVSENTYQRSIGKKTIKSNIVLPYATFFHIVLNGEREPLLIFKDKFPDCKGYKF
jgi:hypothetical protein